MTTPTRTSKADRNLYSVSRNILQFYAGTPNAQTMGPIAPGSVVVGLDLTDDHLGPWDAEFKICDETYGLTYTGLVLLQGQENAIDNNNRAHHCAFAGTFGAAGQRGDQVITVKGGCHDMVYKGTIGSKGNNADIVIGAWSDQCFDPSYSLDFSGLTRADGQPLTFILSRCHDVKLPPGAKVLRLKSIEYTVYFWAKWIYVKILQTLGKA